MQRILNEEGRQAGRKWEANAKGFGIKDQTAVVSFEHNHRIAAFDLTASAVGRSTGPIPFPGARA